MGSRWCSRILAVSSASLVALLAAAPSRWPWSIAWAASLVVASVWCACCVIKNALEREPTACPIREDRADNFKEPYGAERSASLVANLVERLCVWPWYSRHVSKEIAFAFACRELADAGLRKCFEVVAAAGATGRIRLISDWGRVAVAHCVEYKRSEKRRSRMYRFSHPAIAAAAGESAVPEHCANLARALCKELLPWELADTPHADLLAAVLANRLSSAIDERLSDPKWIRSVIARAAGHVFESPPVVHHKEEPVEPKPVPLVQSESITPPTLAVSSSPIPRSVTPEPPEASPRRRPPSTRPIEIAAEPMVKVHERLVEGGRVETWNSDADLVGCVSLGCDLLASLEDEDSTTRLGRLWNAEDASEANSDLWSLRHRAADEIGDDANHHHHHPLWFGEEDNPESEPIEESPPKSAVHTNNILTDNLNNITKPLNIPNIKDLQNLSISTVNQAKNKIGDLQDEAAGMMEGIFDLGMAGLKKGLRLTGIHDNVQHSEKCQDIIFSASESQDSQKLKHPLPKVTISEKADEPTNTSQVNFLTKQQRVSSQDAFIPDLGKESFTKLNQAQSSEDLINTDGNSPDYEYEEAKDLHSSIAKLRWLLQQKAGDVTPISPEEAACEFNEEKSENIANFCEKSPSFDGDLVILPHNSSELYESEDMQKNLTAGGNIQRLDKLFTRTVTGVFNTIKTAVGGDSASEVMASENGANSYQQVAPPPPPVKATDNWLFVRSETDMSILIDHLLLERRGYCVVEAAQDSLDMLGGVSNEKESAKPKAFPDELDEMELMNKYPLWQICIELISISLEGPFKKDVVIKAFNNCIGAQMEQHLQKKLEVLCRWLKIKSVDTFQEMYRNLQESSTDEAPSNVDDISIPDLCNILMSHVPKSILTLIGKDEAYEAIKMFLDSLDHPTVNRDLVLNLLDVTVYHFLKACKSHSSLAMTPPPSA